MATEKISPSGIAVFNEPARLRAVQQLKILDTKPDKAIDEITAMLALIFRAPVAIVSIIDADRQWFKSKVGVEQQETSRGVAFCAYTIASRSTFIIADTLLDDRFATNPIVTGPQKIRFYAGAPIFTVKGHALGALCIMDTKPRELLRAEEVKILESLSDMVSRLLHNRISDINLRNKSRFAKKQHALIAMTRHDGVWEWSIAENLVYLSGGCQRLLGCADVEITAKPQYWLSRVHPADMLRLHKKLASRIHTGDQTFDEEHRVRHEDGSWRWVRAHGLIVRGARGRCEKLVGFFVEVTALRAFDPLTGLLKLSTFTDALAHRLSQRRDSQDEGLVLLKVDIDRFTRVNACFGAVNADRILRDIAKRLENEAHSLGPVIACRLEGDKFMMLIEGVKDDSSVNAITRRLQHALSQPMLCDSVSFEITISVGAVLVRSDEHAADLISKARIALQLSKRAGQAQCVVLSPQMMEEHAFQSCLQMDLRKAIEESELQAFYQPQFDLNSDKLIGCEALVRWQHPQYGLLPSAAFLPVAEESELISAIDLWMLRTACKQVSQWRRSLKGAENLRMSVNVSGHRFSELQLPHTIRNVLEEFALPASALCLEITETVLMRDVEGASSILHGLQRIGVGLHIDDFGAGYSSLSQLCNLPFDTLKIDRSFMKHVVNDKKVQTIVKAIVLMGTGLGMSVVAEGVEEACQSEYVRSLGCDIGQGYLYGRPLSAIEFEDKVLGCMLT